MHPRMSVVISVYRQGYFSPYVPKQRVVSSSETLTFHGFFFVINFSMLILNYSLYDIRLHGIMVVNTTVTTIIPCGCVSYGELTIDYSF